MMQKAEILQGLNHLQTWNVVKGATNVKMTAGSNFGKRHYTCYDLGEQTLFSRSDLGTLLKKLGKPRVG